MSPCPALDFTEVHQQVDQAGRDNISKSQAELRDWEARHAGDWEYLRWPVCFTAANARFTQLWQEKYAPLRKWICDAATCVAAEVRKSTRLNSSHANISYAVFCLNKKKLR